MPINNKFDFYSTQELYNAISDNPYRTEPDPSFSPYNWEDTVSHMMNGWTGFDKMKVDAAIINNGEIYSSEIAFDVEGEFLDMGRYLSGEPECFGNTVSYRKPAQTISLLVDVGVSGFYGAHEIANRGAAIMAMVDSLISRGYIVNMTASSRATDYGKEFLAQVHIDTANGYSKDQIAFLISHPCFLRRIIFALREKVTGNAGDWASKSSEPKGYDLHVKSMNDDGMDWGTLETAKKNIESILEGR